MNNNFEVGYGNVNKVTIGPKQPLAFIGGPCAIESKEHAFKMAELIGEVCDKLSIPWIYKSCYDKDCRSSAASFHGCGIDSGLEILSEVRMFQLLMLRMVPPIVIVAPLSLYYSTLHLLDTITGLVIIYSITTLPYSVWMIKSFIDELPLEIEQAAMILGASRLRTLWEIVFPLVRSGIVATFLFILILTWSEYLLALILSKTEVATLPVELSKYEGSVEGRVYGRQAALAVGVTLPLIAIGIFIRKHLARGFSFGMVKR